MTVSTSTSIANYTANGSTTTFAYPFKIFADSDLVVILRNTATGVGTVQVLNSAYTVTGAGNVAGGNVVFGTAPAAGNTVSYPACAPADARNRLRRRMIRSPPRRTKTPWTS
jgi:hypothetical protein